MKWNLHTANELLGKISLSLYRKKVLKCERLPESGEFVLSLDGKSITQEEERYLVQTFQVGGNSSAISNFLFCEVFGAGPKVFRLDNVDYEALEATTINIPVMDYNQPFPTIVFEFPENYSRKHRVPCEKADKYVWQEFPEEHEPVFCIIHHAKEINCVLAAIHCSSAQMYAAKFSLAEATIEEGLSLEDFDKFVFDKSDPCNEQEKVMFHSAMRAAFNAALLLDEIGCHKVGPENPAYFSRLERHLKKARKEGGERLERAIRDITTHPVIYELNQKVQLRDTIRTESIQERDGGWIVKPHHRRGHYRMQPFGPALSQRKRIRIKPVFVNSHLFLGDPSNTKVTYTNE